MSTDIEHDFMSLRAEQDGWTHRVNVQWFEGDFLDDPELHHLILSLTQAEDLIVHLQSAIRHANERQLDDALRGGCEVCHGTRMVSQEVHGRMVHSHHHCIDCPPRDLWEGPTPPRNPR